MTDKHVPCPHFGPTEDWPEGAHFFWWPDLQRRNIWNALHPVCKRCGKSVGDIVTEYLPALVEALQALMSDFRRVYGQSDFDPNWRLEEFSGYKKAQTALELVNKTKEVNLDGCEQELRIALGDVLAERKRQGTLAFDGDTDTFDHENSRNDWVAYITAFAGRASAKCARNEKDAQDFRKNMVKVGALALAAIEAHDQGWC